MLNYDCQGLTKKTTLLLVLGYYTMMYGDERILQNGLKFTECYTNNLLY